MQEQRFSPMARWAPSIFKCQQQSYLCPSTGAEKGLQWQQMLLEKQKTSHLFALNLLELGIFEIRPPPIRWNLSQSSKIMEIVQKTGWWCNCRSSVSLGNQLRTPNDWRNGPTACYLVAIYILRSLSPMKERGYPNPSFLIVKACDLEAHF